MRPSNAGDMVSQDPLEFLVLNAVTIPLVLLFVVVVRDVREAARRRGHG